MDGFALMKLESCLAVVGPGRLDPVIVGDGSEVGEVGRGQVLVDGEGRGDSIDRDGCSLYTI